MKRGIDLISETTGSGGKFPFIRVSVVVCTYNRRDFFDMCFESLLNQSYPSELFEIVIVDSSDDLQCGENLKLMEKYIIMGQESGIKVKYLFQKPDGISSARNLGIKNSEGDIICFTDDDCIADDNWVRKLVEGFGDLDSEKTGGVGGQIRYLSSGSAVEENQEFINPENYISKWSFIIGANMAYRRDVLEEIGGFDPYFRYGGDDNDIGLRVRLDGYSLKFSPEAIIFFRKRKSISEMVVQHYNYGKGISRIYKKFPEFPFAKHVFLNTVHFFLLAPLYFARCLIGRNVEERNTKSGDEFNFINRFIGRFKSVSIFFVLINSLSNLAYLLGLIAGFLFISYPKHLVVDSKLEFLNIH